MTHLSDKATDQEVLQVAIEKTINNGWSRPGLTDEGTIHYTDSGIVVDWLRGGRTGYALETIIFDHEFLRALFGEEWPSSYPAGDARSGAPMKKRINGPSWQYHGTQMFLAEDRIDYLRKYL